MGASRLADRLRRAAILEDGHSARNGLTHASCANGYDGPTHGSSDTELRKTLERCRVCSAIQNSVKNTWHQLRADRNQTTNEALDIDDRLSLELLAHVTLHRCARRSADQATEAILHVPDCVI